MPRGSSGKRDGPGGLEAAVLLSSSAEDEMPPRRQNGSSPAQGQGRGSPVSKGKGGARLLMSTRDTEGAGLEDTHLQENGETVIRRGVGGRSSTLQRVPTDFWTSSQRPFDRLEWEEQNKERDAAHFRRFPSRMMRSIRKKTATTGKGEGSGFTDLQPLLSPRGVPPPALSGGPGGLGAFRGGGSRYREKDRVSPMRRQFGAIREEDEEENEEEGFASLRVPALSSQGKPSSASVSPRERTRPTEGSAPPPAVSSNEVQRRIQEKLRGASDSTTSAQKKKGAARESLGGYFQDDEQGDESSFLRGRGGAGLPDSHPTPPPPPPMKNQREELDDPHKEAQSRDARTTAAAAAAVSVLVEDSVRQALEAVRRASSRREREREREREAARSASPYRSPFAGDLAEPQKGSLPSPTLSARMRERGGEQIGGREKESVNPASDYAPAIAQLDVPRLTAEEARREARRQMRSSLPAILRIGSVSTNTPTPRGRPLPSGASLGIDPFAGGGPFSDSEGQVVAGGERDRRLRGVRGAGETDALTPAFGRGVGVDLSEGLLGDLQGRSGLVSRVPPDEPYSARRAGGGRGGLRSRSLSDTERGDREERWVGGVRGGRRDRERESGDEYDTGGQEGTGGPSRVLHEEDPNSSFTQFADMPPPPPPPASAARVLSALAARPGAPMSISLSVSAAVNEEDSPSAPDLPSSPGAKRVEGVRGVSGVLSGHGKISATIVPPIEPTEKGKEEKGKGNSPIREWQQHETIEEAEEEEKKAPPRSADTLRAEQAVPEAQQLQLSGFSFSETQQAGLRDEAQGAGDEGGLLGKEEETGMGVEEAGTFPVSSEKEKADDVRAAAAAASVSVSALLDKLEAEGLRAWEARQRQGQEVSGGKGGRMMDEEEEGFRKEREPPGVGEEEEEEERGREVPFVSGGLAERERGAEEEEEDETFGEREENVSFGAADLSLSAAVRVREKEKEDRPPSGAGRSGGRWDLQEEEREVVGSTTLEKEKQREREKELRRLEDEEFLQRLREGRKQGRQAAADADADADADDAGDLIRGQAPAWERGLGWGAGAAAQSVGIVGAVRGREGEGEDPREQVHGGRFPPPLFEGGGGDDSEDEARERVARVAALTAPFFVQAREGRETDARGERQESPFDNRGHRIPSAPPPFSSPPMQRDGVPLYGGISVGASVETGRLYAGAPFGEEYGDGAAPMPPTGEEEEGDGHYEAEFGMTLAEAFRTRQQAVVSRMIARRESLKERAEARAQRQPHLPPPSSSTRLGRHPRGGTSVTRIDGSHSLQSHIEEIIRARKKMDMGPAASWLEAAHDRIVSTGSPPGPPPPSGRQHPGGSSTLFVPRGDERGGQGLGLRGKRERSGQLAEMEQREQQKAKARGMPAGDGVFLLEGPDGRGAQGRTGKAAGGVLREETGTGEGKGAGGSLARLIDRLSSGKREPISRKEALQVNRSLRERTGQEMAPLSQPPRRASAEAKQQGGHTHLASRSAAGTTYRITTPFQQTMTTRQQHPSASAVARDAAVLAEAPPLSTTWPVPETLPANEATAAVQTQQQGRPGGRHTAPPQRHSTGAPRGDRTMMRARERERERETEEKRRENRRQELLALRARAKAFDAATRQALGSRSGSGVGMGVGGGSSGGVAQSKRR
uniref:Uncharacterized protein n=1 Tax=Chromera velia CCMP2878 TaxID=1169474 RepID=A0A0G4HE60_9ALVE|eukprot:Cvel_26673.t1-p1 / transcript=Cvel_26673.t1 / gene=Cvel_26673 / organism=Chromera_velia_CCMP2878 / gene_product=hypothetical protein / transcript_product=hypothetical protein / location=Cvel_scaffold3210:10854-17070(+) / protein_length=1647 / sequence_SO=supercontig / SO=protein_coding / is_pseudo=false